MSRTLIVLGFYSGRQWPEDAATILDITSGQKHTDIPIKSDISHEKPEGPEGPEEPLYGGKVPAYDTENMPAKPSIVEATKKPISSPLTTLDLTRVAVIIETRPQPVLPAVLAQFIMNVPPAWPVRLIGSQEAFSIVTLSSSMARHIKSGKLVLTELPDFYPVHDSEALSQTLTNLTFYSELLRPAEWILFFQTDSMICSASEQSLDDWVEKGYTWVGAPWNMNVIGGNGGFSLRHVPSIVKVLQKGTREPGYFLWEDRWLCDQLTNIAPAQVSRTFSVESEYYERPLGYHLRGSGKFLDPQVWKNATRKRQILEYCPETKIILEGEGLEPVSEEKKEKHLDANASALGMSSKGIATTTKDENGKQPPETKAPTSATVTATETTESAPGPTKTDRSADTKA
jgi:hypothetical protein